MSAPRKHFPSSWDIPASMTLVHVIGRKKKEVGNFAEARLLILSALSVHVLRLPMKSQILQAKKLRTFVNEDKMQESTLDDMIFDVPTLISFLSGSTTLLPGTLILTGTPSGVGEARNPKRFLVPGDEVTVEIDESEF